MEDQLLYYVEWLSIIADLRICRFVASELFTIEYNTIDRWKAFLKGYLLIYKIVHGSFYWAMAKSFQCICNCNPSYFQF